MSNDSPGLRSLVLKRTPYQHEQLPFVVLWSQKSGCTSILKWFLWHAGLLADAQTYAERKEGITVHNYEREVFVRTPGYLDDLVARIEAGVPIISFVRCPYARAFSSYMHLHNRFYIRFERDGIADPGLALRYTILEALYGYRPPVEYPISFIDYLAWLESSALADLEPHHAPQVTALFDLPGVTHFRLEDQDIVMPRLEAHYQLADSSVVRAGFQSGHHLSKSSDNSRAFDVFCARGVSLSRSPNYVLPDVGRALMEGTECGERIARIFREDIALYDSLPHAAISETATRN